MLSAVGLPDLLSLSQIQSIRVNAARGVDRSKSDGNVLSVDQVDLSSQAIQRLELVQMLDTFVMLPQLAGSRTTKTIEQVGEDLAADLAGIGSQIGDLFQIAGIDLSTPLTLRGDGEGHILVEGKNPDGGKAEELLSDNPAFAARFMVMAARAALVETAETDPSFLADYQTDPFDAIRKHIGSLEEALFGFRFDVSESGVGYHFV